MSDDVVENGINDANDPNDIDVNVNNEVNEPIQPNANVPNPNAPQGSGYIQGAVRKMTHVDRENGVLFEAPINQVVAIIGGLALLLLIIALLVDELWIKDGQGDSTFSLGWNKSRMISGYSDANMGSKFDGSRRTWVAFGILTVFALSPAVFGLILDKKIIEHFNGRLTQKKLNMILAILFGISAFFLFIASVVVAAYDDNGLDAGASPILGFITMIVMLVPIPLLIWF